MSKECKSPEGNSISFTEDVRYKVLNEYLPFIRERCFIEEVECEAGHLIITLVLELKDLIENIGEDDVFKDTIVIEEKDYIRCIIDKLEKTFKDFAYSVAYLKGEHNEVKTTD